MYTFILLATTALAMRITKPDTAAPQHCPPACDSALLGNGVCDDVCNIADCAFDHGDCDTANTDNTDATDGPIHHDDECAVGCPLTWIGDGICDGACQVEACQFDGSDCDESDHAEDDYTSN